jgi:protoporphyrinogen oxidase
MLADSKAPPAHGSIQCEVYFSDKYKPLNESLQSVVDRAVADLRKCGVLHADEPLIKAEAHLLRHANIIFDLERAEAVKIVHGYLRDIGVEYCGRYGEWGYLWTDESYISGERAAERALSAGG